MAKQICTKDGTEYDGVAEDGSASVCPTCGNDQYQSEGLVPDGWQPESEPQVAPIDPVPVAEPEVPAEPVTPTDPTSGVANAG